MPAPKKMITDYERESKYIGDCLIHPSSRVSRAVYQLRHGKLDSKILVCHTCDNSRCILDDHHFEGTPQDNVKDAVKKGRHSCFKNCAKPGELHPFYGKCHSDQAIKKISDASKRMWKERRAKN